MKDEAHRAFRLDNDVLAFRFTATMSDRGDEEPNERLSSTDRLALWLDAVGLGVEQEITGRSLRTARELREAIYRLGVSAAAEQPSPRSALRLLNTMSAKGHPVPRLSGEGRVWQISSLKDAFAVIAQDAVAVLGAQETHRIKVCEGPGCAGLFLDTSRGGNRRWCSMNTCGNRMKKTRMAAR